MCSSSESAASAQQLNASTTQHHLAVAQHKRRRAWNPKRHAAEQSSDCSRTHVLAHTHTHTHTHTHFWDGWPTSTTNRLQDCCVFQNDTLQHCLRTTDNPTAVHSLHRSVRPLKTMQGTKEANDKPPIPSPPAQLWPTLKQVQPPRSSSSTCWSGCSMRASIQPSQTPAMHWWIWMLRDGLLGEHTPWLEFQGLNELGVNPKWVTHSDRHGSHRQDHNLPPSSLSALTSVRKTHRPGRRAAVAWGKYSRSSHTLCIQSSLMSPAQLSHYQVDPRPTPRFGLRR
jgi:hypothetical protein